MNPTSTLKRRHCLASACALMASGLALSAYAQGPSFPQAKPLSLVVPYDMTSMRRAWAHPGILVRFSIGLEAVADLQADLQQSLERMA